MKSEKKSETKSKRLVEKKQLRNATPEQEKVLVERVSDRILSNKFGKEEVRHDAEALLNNKKPQVNKTTRPAYEGFCSLMKQVARDNGALLQKVRNFEERYLN